MTTLTAAVLLTAARAQETPTPKPAAPRLPKHITPEAHQAIERGLAYLARTQDRQGSWSNRGAFGEYPVAMTALAGLALLMDGNTTTQGRYAPQVDRAANYLLRSATQSGLITRGDEDSRPMYGHGFSLLFLGQLYGMTEDTMRGQQIHELLSRAVQLTARAQSDAGGWIYTPDSNSDEGSVTITQVQGLRSCRNAGITVPKDVIDDAMAYLDKSQNSDGGIRYSLRQQAGGSRPPITAAAVCCWYNAGDYTNPRAKRALEFAKDKIRPNGTSGGHDYYAHLYLAQALYVSSDPYWQEYFPQRRDYLIQDQKSDGSWLGDGVGDVYGTAIALIILQLPYNQIPIMQR
jgi:squalene cyclase